MDLVSCAPLTEVPDNRGGLRQDMSAAADDDDAPALPL